MGRQPKPIPSLDLADRLDSDPGIGRAVVSSLVCMTRTTMFCFEFTSRSLAARNSDDRVRFGRIDIEVFCCSDLRGQPDAQLSVDRRNVHLLGNGPPIVVRIANTRGQDHSIALNLLIWKLRQ